MIGYEVFAKVVEAEKTLDKLNLDVAEWRMGCGMSEPLASLYMRMGALSKALKEAKKIANLSSYIEALSKSEERKVKK